MPPHNPNPAPQPQPVSDAGRLENERLRDALAAAQKHFGCGAGDGWWGRIKAWIVNGAPNRDDGIAAARRITDAQVELDNAAHAVEEKQ